MPSKLHLVVDAYTKFEVSSFSHSKGIGVHTLKIWALSSTLYSTLSGLSQFCLIRGATEYHLVKFECNLSMCVWDRAMWLFQLSHIRAPIGTMGLRVLAAWRLQQMKAQAIQYCFRFLNFWFDFKSQWSENEWGRKTMQKYVFFDLL